MAKSKLICIGDTVKFNDELYSLSEAKLIEKLDSIYSVSNDLKSVIVNCIKKDYELVVRDMVLPEYADFITEYTEYFPEGYAFLSYKELVPEDDEATPNTWIYPYLIDIRLLKKVKDASESEFYLLTSPYNDNRDREVIITNDKEKLRKILRENPIFGNGRMSEIDSYINRIAGAVVTPSHRAYAPDDYDTDWTYDSYPYDEFEANPRNDVYRYVGCIFYTTRRSATPMISIDMIESFYYDGYEEPERDIEVCCDRCGSVYTITTKENRELSTEDRNLCPGCRKREYIAPYHKYSPTIDFKMTKEEAKLKTDVNFNKFLGAEIEVAFGGEINSNAANAMKFMNYEDGEFKEFNIYASHDSSIENGFELITQPMTMARHAELRKNYEDMFKWLVVKKGYRAHNSNCCGLHVHFSRNYFAEDVNGEYSEIVEEANISKLLYIVEKYWGEIVLFSRRNYNTLERYAKKIDTKPKDFIADWNKTNDHEGRYYSINLTNRDTIEFRMFKGTLNANTYFATLEFVDKLITVVKNSTVEELQKMAFEDFLTPLALEYYNSRKDKYGFDEDTNTLEEIKEIIADSDRRIRFGTEELSF